MRYEAKHNYLKKLRQSLGNFINISWTLAMRHQYLQCYYTASGCLFHEQTEIGPGVQQQLCFTPYIDLLFVYQSGLFIHYYLTHYKNLLLTYRANWVKHDGITYRKPCALIKGIENDYPTFARLENIFIIDSRILFHVTTLKTVKFNTHLHAYVVTPSSVTDFILITQIHCHTPVHIHRVIMNDNAFSVIACKYHIYGTLLD